MSEPRRILDDDPHGLGASLVRAARDERPPPQSKRKALVGLGLVAGSATAATNAGAALSAAKSAGTLPLVLLGKWMGVGVVVGAVAVGGAVSIDDASTPPQLPVPSRTAVPTPPDPERVKPPEATSSLAVESLPTAAPASRYPYPGVATAVTASASAAGIESSVPPGPSALEAELALVDGARAALRAGRARQAVLLLNRRDAEHPRGALGIESTVLRIEALAHLGDRTSARALGRQFLEQHPSSPLTDRVRASMGGDSP